MSPDRLPVALLGTGLMGYAMAEKLLENGWSATVWNRTRAKAEPLGQRGATVADAPWQAVAAAEVVVLMLADMAAIRATLLTEAVRPYLAGKTFIQMGTIAPLESQDLQAILSLAGAEYLEAPVLGSIPQIRSASLLIMAGCTPEQFKRWQGLLRQWGPSPERIGPVGQAAAIKLAFNQLIASLISAFALSLGYIQRSGVEVETFMGLLRQSALFAPTFDKKLPGMLARRFDHPNCPTKHILKDVELCLQAMGQAGLETASLEGVQRLLALAVAQGWGEADYSSLFCAVNPPA